MRPRSELQRSETPEPVVINNKIADAIREALEAGVEEIYVMVDLIIQADTKDLNTRSAVRIPIFLTREAMNVILHYFDEQKGTTSIILDQPKAQAIITAVSMSSQKKDEHL